MKHSFLSFYIVFLSFIIIINAYSNPSNCTSDNQYYNMISLDCTNCPFNNSMKRGGDFTYCNCTSPFYSNPDIIGFNSANNPCINLVIIV